MSEELKLFEGNRIRHIYDEEKETYYFSVVDIIAILIEKDYQSARKYWNKLAQRLRDEGSEQTVTNCHQLKLQANDGKMRKTDVIHAHLNDAKNGCAVLHRKGCHCLAAVAAGKTVSHPTQVRTVHPKQPHRLN